MNDRELLELAAKAAGIEYDFICPTGAHCGDVYTMRDYFWNPLDNDGDALRLVVKLHLEIVHPIHPDGVIVSRADIAPCAEPYTGDELVATRRAIVRAAAEIGKGME